MFLANNTLSKNVLLGLQTASEELQIFTQKLIFLLVSKLAFGWSCSFSGKRN